MPAESARLKPPSLLATFVDEDGNGIEPATGTADEKAAKKALNQATAAFLKGYVTNACSDVIRPEFRSGVLIFECWNYVERTSSGVSGTRTAVAGRSQASSPV